MSGADTMLEEIKLLELRRTKVSSISSVSSQQYIPKVNAAPVQRANVDSDGDHDGSKSGEIENKSPPQPTSATIGNNVNTTA